MTSLIPAILTEIQGSNLNTVAQCNAYKKTVKVLKYTAFLDLALSIIFSVLGVAFLSCPPLSWSCFVVSLVCLASGSAFLKMHSLTKQLMEARLEYFHFRRSYALA
ncbi:MAG: hypothetical protein VX777_02340 [Chlamydiota bacterium]|nr:hypothetical protein [Chlamydiota bacterium]